MESKKREEEEEHKAKKAEDKKAEEVRELEKKLGRAKKEEKKQERKAGKAKVWPAAQCTPTTMTLSYTTSCLLRCLSQCHSTSKFQFYTAKSSAKT